MTRSGALTAQGGGGRCAAGWMGAVTDWSAVRDACGPAGHVPPVLDRFAADPDGVWPELMDHLCPQLDTAFPASFAALPRLAQIAAAAPPGGRAVVLLAAGAILSCAPPAGDPQGPLAFHAAPIGVLRALADRQLSRTCESGEYVDLLQALLSFEGVQGWDRCLGGLAGGEYEVDCPHCGVNIFVVLAEDGGFCCTGDDALGEVVRWPLRPAGLGDLGALGRRLHDRALADGQPGVARGVRYLFGRVACPDCGTAFGVADRVAGRWEAGAG